MATCTFCELKDPHDGPQTVTILVPTPGGLLITTDPKGCKDKNKNPCGMATMIEMPENIQQAVIDKMNSSVSVLDEYGNNTRKVA